MNIIIKFIKTIQCLKNGHKSEPFFSDEECYAYTSRCSNCHTKLGMPKFKNHNCPPPPYKGVKMSCSEWNQFVDNKMKELENEVNLKRSSLGLS
jgi:hypothetical protein